MNGRQFQLVSEWQLEAPLDQVWQALCAVDRWPGWWRAVRRVEPLAAGDHTGIGAVNRFTWGTALPYDLVVVMTVTDMQPMRRIEGQATGELQGRGVWTLDQAEGLTIARYDWRVDVTKSWMRHLAPLLAPVFAWNHNQVMRLGEEGLRRNLKSVQD